MWGFYGGWSRKTKSVLIFNSKMSFKIACKNSMAKNFSRMNRMSEYQKLTECSKFPDDSSYFVFDVSEKDVIQYLEISLLYLFN